MSDGNLFDIVSQENHNYSNERRNKTKYKYAYRVYVVEVVFQKFSRILPTDAFEYKSQKIYNYFITDIHMQKTCLNNAMHEFNSQLWYGIKHWLDEGYFIAHLHYNSYDVDMNDKDLFDQLTDYQKLSIAEKFFKEGMLRKDFSEILTIIGKKNIIYDSDI